MSDPIPGFSPLYEVQSAPGLVMLSRPRRRYWLYSLAFVATLYTTLAIGARLQFNFEHHLPAYVTDEDIFPFLWVLQQPAQLLKGIPFAASLMLILMAHEMGHYIACLRYKVFATLPFFIPAPTPIGTLGAFIRIKSPIPSRRALFDIGIAGPIAGFAVAVPILFVAIALSQPALPNSPDPQIQFTFPLIFDLANRWFGAGVGLDDLLLHPIGIAAWVGMFATALNLLPGGQLDGGHIVYALRPRWHRWISRITVITLVGGIFFWIGWGIWAALLTLSGMRHPPLGSPLPPLFPDQPWESPWAPLGPKRVALSLFAAAMLILTFMPAPFIGGGLGH
jgi:membrane-associated protease RseP (regulator of RpoE activity)